MVIKLGFPLESIFNAASVVPPGLATSKINFSKLPLSLNTSIAPSAVFKTIYFDTLLEKPNFLAALIIVKKNKK